MGKSWTTVPLLPTDFTFTGSPSFTGSQRTISYLRLPCRASCQPWCVLILDARLRLQRCRGMRSVGTSIPKWLQCWYEMKTSKTKTFALDAGKTRDDDVYLKGGDWLATNQRAAPAYDSKSQEAYVFPSFKSKRNSGTAPVFAAQPNAHWRANFYCCLEQARS